ncbi:ROK family protein [Limnochorda pilosa]|uniref:Glucokinase n=1 Tax=Limnochorda pilosa TaxID=1555112 RepID=A0A0K2SLD2_LIMPI|nr:ROK family protein [Limnochorda pilosa]BAS27910.1 glucokinase [Limnochorda pilosa]
MGEAEAPRFVGVDVGGTKVAAGIVTANGDVLAWASRAVARGASASTVVEEIRDAVEEARSRARVGWEAVRAVGVGAPGRVDPQAGTWEGSSNLVLDSGAVPLRYQLEAWAGLPTFLENDVKAAALGEFHHGVGHGLGTGTRSLLYVSVGTGLAAGLVMDGELFRGTGEAGEIGHIPVVADGYPCNCGQRGCLETVASGRALARWAREVVEDAQWATSMGRQRLDGAPLNGQDVLEAAARGDRAALDLRRRLARGIALAVVIGVRAYDPDLVVLGGGVAVGGERPLLDEVRAAVGTLAPELRKAEACVHLTPLGHLAGVVGAATVARLGLSRM